MVNYTFEDVEFAGAMTLRFLHVEEDDYDDTDGIPLSRTEAGLSRIQHAIVDVIDDSGAYANYVEEDEEIHVYDDSGELAGGSEVELRVIAIGRQ